MSAVPSPAVTPTLPIPSSHRPHTCPPWIAWLLASPLRRLLEDPRATLGSLVMPGQTVLEVGPGYGFYTLPVAELVQHGRVVCADVHPQMLDEVRRRARRRGLESRIELRRVHDADLGDDLNGAVDLVLALNVVHEATSPARLISSMARALRPGGRLLLIEPRGHCPEDLYAAELRWAEAKGLRIVEEGRTRSISRAVLER